MPETIAVFDVGSNSIKLLVAKTGPGAFEILHEDLRTTRLIAAMRPGKPLDPQAVEATLAVLKTFRAKAVELGAGFGFAAGTCALRIAADAEEFTERVQKETRIRLVVLSGEEEGELAFLGATSDVTGKEHVVVDIGGGSTECIAGINGRIQWAKSFPMGAVTMTERFLRADPPALEESDRFQVHIDRVLKPVFDQPPGRRAALILVGGAVAAAAALIGKLAAPKPSLVHGRELNLRDLMTLHQKLLRLSSKDRRRLPGMDPDRSDILPAGLQILLTLMNRWNTGRARVSARGLRHGLAIQRMRGLR